MKSADVASTTIGQSVHIRGEVTGSENLYIDGSVEGSISLLDARLTVGPNARLKADVAAQDVIVQGLVEGNIRATGTVELRQTARVVGDLYSVRLSMEDSAMMTGRIELATASAPATASPAARLDAVPRTPQRDPVTAPETVESATLFSAPAPH